MVDTTKLPRAQNRFEDLRKGGKIYVDHTDLMNLPNLTDLIFCQDPEGLASHS